MSIERILSAIAMPIANLRGFSKHFERCVPQPAAMISTLRAFGYDLSMTVADLIESSNLAKATKISVSYDWNEVEPRAIVAYAEVCCVHSFYTLQSYYFGTDCVPEHHASLLFLRRQLLKL